MPELTLNYQLDYDTKCSSFPFRVLTKAKRRRRIHRNPIQVALLQAHNQPIFIGTSFTSTLSDGKHDELDIFYARLSDIRYRNKKENRLIKFLVYARDDLKEWKK